jgi:hypothetical protein
VKVLAAAGPASARHVAHSSVAMGASLMCNLRW